MTKSHDFSKYHRVTEVLHATADIFNYSDYHLPGLWHCKVCQPNRTFPWHNHSSCSFCFFMLSVWLSRALRAIITFWSTGRNLIGAESCHFRSVHSRISVLDKTTCLVQFRKSYEQISQLFLCCLVMRKSMRQNLKFRLCLLLFRITRKHKNT